MVRRRASFRRARLHAAPAIRACARQTLSVPAHSTVRAAILALDDYEEAAQGEACNLADILSAVIALAECNSAGEKAEKSAFRKFLTFSRTSPRRFRRKV
jgi:hypothetical protein